MQKPTITSAQMSVLLPTSFKVLSETLTPEAMHAFTSEMAEINSRMEAQKTANEQLKADYDTEKGKVTALESEKTTLTNEKTMLSNEKVLLSNEVTRLKPFEQKITELTTAGKLKPNEDVNSRAGESQLPANHPNAIAIAQFKEMNGIQ